MVSMETEDVISAARYLRYLRDPAHASFASLLQMKLKASDVVQTVEEMAILTHELLTLDPSSADTTRAITIFAEALCSDLPDPFPDQPLNQIIKCLRLAMMHKPEMRAVHFFLGKYLIIHYYYHTAKDELDEAVSILEEAIHSGSLGDKFVAKCQKVVADLAVMRSAMNDDPEISEEAIYRARAFLAASSPQEVLYPAWSHVLENAANNRFQNFGPIGRLEPSSGYLLPPWPVADETHPLFVLLDHFCDYVIADVDETIELGRSILASSNPNDLHAPRLLSDILSSGKRSPASDDKLFIFTEFFGLSELLSPHNNLLPISIIHEK
ncbi:hypothetical protein V8E53_000892 [Lactarius tabidus]